MFVFLELWWILKINRHIGAVGNRTYLTRVGEVSNLAETECQRNSKIYHIILGKLSFPTSVYCRRDLRIPITNS